MQKTYLILIFISLFSFPLSGKLRIRQENPQWAPRHYRCCADRRGMVIPYGAASPQEAVNELREDIIEEYDSGAYLANWGKKRRAILELQSQLGRTVPEDYSFNEGDQ